MQVHVRSQRLILDLFDVMLSFDRDAECALSHSTRQTAPVPALKLLLTVWGAE